MHAWPSSCVVPVQPAAVELLTALSPVLARWGRWYAGDLDASRIRRTLKLLEEALGQSDLLSGFESIQGRGTR